MNRIIHILIFGSFLNSCGNLAQKNSTTNTKAELTDSYIYNLCDSIINNQDIIDHVWNFNEVDSGTIEHYDLNLFDTMDGEKIVTIKGFTGCSSGCSGSLIMIFEPTNNNLIHVSQEPVDLTFIDFDNDGKLELLSHNLIMWMGECREYHSLFDIEKETTYFSLNSSSPEICGLTEEDLNGQDTLLNTSDLLFKDVDDDQIDEIILTTKVRTVSDTTLRTVIDTIKIKN